jgi:glycosyltransferase involved in cell wall biosynthesis
VSAKIPFVLIDASARQRIARADYVMDTDEYIVDEPVYDTDIAIFDPATRYRYYSWDVFNGNKLPGSIIALSPWELPKWPSYLDFVFKYINGFWSATTYIKDAFSTYLSSNKIVMSPPSVRIPKSELDDFDVRVASEQFTFLTIFDGESGIARKNPHATIKAFLRAFPEDQTVRLLVKSMNLNMAAPSAQELLRIINNDSRIQFINEKLNKADLYKLSRQSHCFVSLHRAEGFGRNIAEAMLMNRPCIVSDFSGNLDFCTDETAFLVGGQMIPISPEEYFCGRGQYWFDASVEAAAVVMRQVYEDRPLAAKKARQARDHMKTFHSIEAAGKRYRILLEQAGVIHA